MNRIAQAGICK